MTGCLRIRDRRPTSGNPVRIGDGCATVTGYKLPATNAGSPQTPLAGNGREGGSKVETRSQDTGWAVLVGLFANANGHFSDKEKDEASPLICFQRSS